MYLFVFIQQFHCSPFRITNNSINIRCWLRSCEKVFLFSVRLSLSPVRFFIEYVGKKVKRVLFSRLKGDKWNKFQSEYNSNNDAQLASYSFERF